MIHISREPTVSFVVFFSSDKLYVTSPIIPFSLVLDRLKEDDSPLEVSLQQQDGTFSVVTLDTPVFEGAIFRVDYPRSPLVLQKKGEFYVIKNTPLVFDKSQMKIIGYLIKEVNGGKYTLVQQSHPLMPLYTKRYGL
jgi:hypothetical protein